MFPRRLGVAGYCTAQVEHVEQPGGRQSSTYPQWLMAQEPVRLLNVTQKNYSAGLLLV